MKQIDSLPRAGAGEKLARDCKIEIGPESKMTAKDWKVTVTFTEIFETSRTEPSAAML